MKKIMSLCLIALIVSACSQSVYNEEETKILQDANVYEKATSDCTNTDSVKVMIANDQFKGDYIDAYCDLLITSSEGVNELLEQGVSVEDVETYLSLDNFHVENVERYVNEPSDTIEQKVMNVNMNLDLEPYATTNVIEDDSDMALLVNKYSALPQGYIPSDLVDIKYVCEIGKDYSCTTMDRVQLREEAAKAYEAFVEAAQEEDLKIVAIAAYRSYSYQKGLYDYNANLYGVEFADTYYARPGQSEHNSGLAVDITFNDYNFNEIENYEGYEWILENMHKYGFILRYPEDKTDITKYSYESWHLRYVGEDVATTIYENDWTLEEYYGAK